MKKTVLIVDDSAFMRNLMKDSLAKAGYAIAGEAGSGETAIEKFRELKPDLMTLDLVMLGKGGLQALKEILSFDPTAKILMVSAMGQEELVTEAIRSGAKGFIIKPFKPEGLLAEVKRVLDENGKESTRLGRG
jgi:two-component system chemotaxis response regulator CheY